MPRLTDVLTNKQKTYMNSSNFKAITALILKIDGALRQLKTNGIGVNEFTEDRVKLLGLFNNAVKVQGSLEELAGQFETLSDKVQQFSASESAEASRSFNP